MRFTLAPSVTGMAALALSLQGCVTPIVVTVKDDLGRPVSGLKLKAKTDNSVHNYALAMQGIKGRNEAISFKTDENGVGSGLFWGYVEYEDREELKPSVYIRLADDSNYWNYTTLPAREKAWPFSTMRATMTLRRKIKPHLMNYGAMKLDMLKPTPEKKTLFLQKSEIGYDMVYGDFLPPLGDGAHADLILQAEILPNEKFKGEELAKFFLEESLLPDPGSKPAPRPPFTVRYTFRFAGEGNGAVLVPMPRIWALTKGELDHSPGFECSLTHVIPQEAPESGYQSVIIRHREFIPKAEKDPSFTTPERLAKRSWWIMYDGKHDIRDDAVYFFRIRGEKESKNAYYGVIKSDFCIRERGGAYMQYIINPTQGERNVEELEDLEHERQWRKLPLKKKDSE